MIIEEKAGRIDSNKNMCKTAGKMIGKR